MTMAENSFPRKTKPQSNVFSSPQKMDPPPASLKQARAVDRAARANANDKNGHGNTGASPEAIRAAAMRSKRKNPNG
jgi:hypothetical protein